MLNIVCETPKALKLDVDGLVFWVKKAWVGKTGNLTKKGQEALEAARFEAAQLAEGKQPVRVYAIHQELFKTETEKAIGFYASDRGTQVVWVPKSQVVGTEKRVNGFGDDYLVTFVPTWCVDRNASFNSYGEPQTLWV
ncbi:hypothetical protein UFOVP380_38 [uncultured Caudovirales phage]|uniref:Uncharacterized protein n=1 Tax=uncultured Caudovirales phage TaxID=2100421 RepID=A0A6J7WZ95_9CAUD|nr:hypothetical protein UFOVP380_38 [uncultured Caudovirales phage]